MRVQKADDAVAQLVVDISDKQRVLDAVTHLQTSYPDLVVERDLGATTSLLSTKFISIEANKIAEDVDVIVGSIVGQHAAVEAWPYTTVDGYKVYCQPPRFEIGKVKISGFGVEPVDGWEDKMEQADVAKSAIKKARAYLKKNPPISY